MCRYGAVSFCTTMLLCWNNKETHRETVPFQHISCLRGKVLSFHLANAVMNSNMNALVNTRIDSRFSCYKLKFLITQ